MKSAANKATGQSPMGDDPESPGEQTVSFEAIRGDEAAAPGLANEAASSTEAPAAAGASVKDGAATDPGLKDSGTGGAVDRADTVKDASAGDAEVDDTSDRDVADGDGTVNDIADRDAEDQDDIGQNGADWDGAAEEDGADEDATGRIGEVMGGRAGDADDPQNSLPQDGRDIADIKNTEAGARVGDSGERTGDAEDARSAPYSRETQDTRGAVNAEGAPETPDPQDAGDIGDIGDIGDTGGIWGLRQPEPVEEPGPRAREVLVPEPVSRAFGAALAELRESVIGLHFGLDLPGAEEARKAQADILSQLGNYIIPRVHMSSAPALIVIAGSTGAGKSTVVNSLASAKISVTGVRRPTTGTPILVCHPEDREWFAKGNVLSGLTRVMSPGAAPGMSSFVLTSSPGLPEGVALLDTPDIDSVIEEHHEIAHRMLDVADLWVFVTTAARYADAPSWQLLKLAKERGARLVIVLARVPAKARDVIMKHFARMLDDYGLGEVERFVIHETTVTGGRLPDEEIRELRMWLAELSVDGERRTKAVRTTLDGALNSFRVRIPALARQLEAQVAFRAELRTDVDAAYMGALGEIDEATRNGSLLRGEVLARWQDFAGSGDIKHTLHLRRPGRFSGKARQQAPMRLRALKSALRAGLESIIIAAAQRAAEDVVTRWRNRSRAGDRLAATPGLGRPSEELIRRTSHAISAWQDHIAELVRTEGVTKRSIARVLSFDVDSLAVIFAVGLLGYQSSEALGSGAGSLPERLLRGLLGAESLRSIGAKARSDLRARIGMLFDEETLRYVQALDGAGIPDESAATRLYQATYNLEVAR